MGICSEAGGAVYLRRRFDGGQTAAGVRSGGDPQTELERCSGEQKSVIVLTVDPLDGTCRPLHGSAS